MSSSNITRPGSPMVSLTAPSMSASSSSTSLNSKMWSAETSRRGSNASSVAPSIATITTKEKTTATSEMAAPPVSQATSCRASLVHTNDPLRRAYPKPEGELDVAEALAREPLRWSLNHWRKNARDVRVPASAHPHSDVSKQRFQDTKADLMRSFAAMQSPATKQ